MTIEADEERRAYANSGQGVIERQMVEEKIDAQSDTRDEDRCQRNERPGSVALDVSS